MKRTAIIQLLQNIVEKFIKEGFRTNKELGGKFRKEAYITGGCIPSMMRGDRVNDIDIYFKDKAMIPLIKNHFVDIAKSKSKKTEDLGMGFFKYKYGVVKKVNAYRCPAFMSPHAISFNTGPKIQLILGFPGDSKEITDKFDWAHIKSYYDIAENRLYVKDETYEIITEKKLVYTGSDYPLSSLMRVRKYLAKGWTISAPEMLKIALDLQNFDLTVKETIIAQMTGIDPITVAAELSKLRGDLTSIDDRMAEIDELILGWPIE